MYRIFLKLYRKGCEAKSNETIPKSGKPKFSKSPFIKMHVSSLGPHDCETPRFIFHNIIIRVIISLPNTTRSWEQGLIDQVKSCQVRIWPVKQSPDMRYHWPSLEHGCKQTPCHGTKSHCLGQRRLKKKPETTDFKSIRKDYFIIYFHCYCHSLRLIFLIPWICVFY